MASPKIQNLSIIFDLHKSMAENQVIVAYEGELNAKVTQSVLSLAESNLDQKKVATQAKRKAFNIALECLQNISNHGDRSEESPNCIFIIGQTLGVN